MTIAAKLRLELLSAALDANGRDDVPDRLKDRLAVAVGRLAEAQRRGEALDEAIHDGEVALREWKEFVGPA